MAQSPATYTVDSTQSVVSVRGQLAGIDLMQQGAGSLSTSYSGTIDALVGTNSIQLTSNSSVVAANSGSWRPLATGQPGSEPANYGFEATGAIPPELLALIPPGVIPAGVSISGIEIETAMRNLEISFDGPPLPVSAGGMVPGTQVVARVVTGDVAVSVGVIPTILGFPLPAINVTNFTFAITNTVATNSNPNTSLTQTNGIETLRIELDNLLQFTGLASNDSAFQLQGQFVASRVLPLPPTNSPPVLAAISNIQVIAGSTVSVVLVASDPDVGQTLTTTVSGAPAVLTSNGFTWATVAADGFSTANLTVVVTDNGMPPLSATQTVAVAIAGPPIVTGFVPAAGTRDVAFTAMPGFNYDLEVAVQPGSNAAWAVQSSMVATNALGVITETAPCSPNQVYRVRLRP